MEDKKFDVIVIGSGHAGCEACLASARMGLKTLLLTLNLDSIAFLACNPSVGGTAKSHLVCEIDALGGEMGVNADKAAIQRRMLNSSKGPAVQSIRAQEDKVMYHTYMKSTLESQENLFIKQAEAEKIITKKGAICGVRTLQGEIYQAPAVVVCTGVYLNSRVIIGSFVKQTGPNGFEPATKLTKSIASLGHEIFRFKTGTPVRVHGGTIDFSCLDAQEGEDDIQTFSFLTKKAPKNVAKCYLTHTNETTHQIIKDNLHRSPLYGGIIKGRGPRYCPSIEDKVVRFADKNAHQLFLEPEAMSTQEIYIQGLSTSLPIDVQEKIVKSIKGLEKSHIMRDAYAIEYDCINSLQLYPTLESKLVKGLFFAGQVNGTSGYEEAGAQGLIAGINAALEVQGKKQITLARDQAYIGVLIDDLVTKGTNEPYRMMTSRAEHRLILRQDNADIRLTEMGRQVGLVKDDRYKLFKKRQKEIEQCFALLDTKITDKKALKELLDSCGESEMKSGSTFRDLIKRSQVKFADIVKYFDVFDNISNVTLTFVETEVKYEGYLKRQDAQIQEQKRQENMELPTDFDYNDVKGLRKEAQQKLNMIKPLNVGQASRISGVSPADISVLLVYLKVMHANNK